MFPRQQKRTCADGCQRGCVPNDLPAWDSRRPLLGCGVCLRQVALDPPQVRQKIGSALVPQISIFFQKLENYGIEIFAGRWGLGLAGQYGIEEHRICRTCEWGDRKSTRL